MFTIHIVRIFRTRCKHGIMNPMIILGFSPFFFTFQNPFNFHAYYVCRGWRFWWRVVFCFSELNFLTSSFCVFFKIINRHSFVTLFSCLISKIFNQQRKNSEKNRCDRKSSRGYYGGGQPQPGLRWYENFARKIY